MELPKIETLKKNIVHWIQENFKKATLEFHVDKDKFELARVDMITKVWSEKDYWLVEAVVEYALGGPKMETMTFQVDRNGKIIGYDLHRRKMAL